MTRLEAQGAIMLRIPAEEGVAMQLSYRAPADITPMILQCAPDQVPGLVRRLFAICADAQGHAAKLALDAAQGLAPDADLARQEIRVAAETCREHGLRIALDWTAILGEPPDSALARRFVNAARGQDPAQLALVSSEGVFAQLPAAWLAIDSASGLARWASGGRTAAARFIAQLFDARSLGALVDGDPIGLSARHADHPLLASALAPGSLIAAHVARLIDLARWGQHIDDLETGRAAPLQGHSLAPGQGWSEVPCARGMLRHEVTLRGEAIDAYRITSPTERVFAGEGAAQRLIAALPTLPKAPRVAFANLLMQALDPCIAYTIEAA